MTPVSEPEVQIIGPDGVPIGVFRRPLPPPRRLWLHLLLFGISFITTTAFGALQFGERTSALVEQLLLGVVPPAGVLVRLLTDPTLLVEGMTFSVPLLAILLAHETGHYVACRRHRLDATLPFFLPAPLGIGTFGAFIRIRSAIASKRELLDVGAAGPLAGFIVTVPLLVVGIALSQPTTTLPESGDILFGEPLAFFALGRLLHPELAAGGDLLVHPVATAAWFGLLVTALNLLPFGQLDGGHIAYAALGRLHRRLAWPLLIGLVLLGVLWSGWWLWAVIALVMGVRHPRVADEPVPLDRTRRLVAHGCLALFLLSFTPAPVTIVP